MGRTTTTPCSAAIVWETKAERAAGRAVCALPVDGRVIMTFIFIGGINRAAALPIFGRREIYGRVCGRRLGFTCRQS